MCIRHRPGAGLSAAYAEEVQVVDIVEGNGEKIRRSSLALLHYVGFTGAQPKTQESEKVRDAGSLRCTSSSWGPSSLHVGYKWRERATLLSPPSGLRLPSRWTSPHCGTLLNLVLEEGRDNLNRYIGQHG
eukprot:2597063-Pyramimonas_sp.AAC.1